MKKLILTPIAILSVLWLDAQKEINPSIVDVTVFLSGAELHHKVEVNLTNGKQTISFTGLSAELIENSVVVECEQKSVSIQSVNVRNNYLKPLPPDNRSMSLRDSLNVLDYDLKILRYETATLQKELDMLFRNEALGGTTSGIPVAEIQKAADFFRERSNGINREKLKKELEITKLELLKNNYAQQLDEYNSRTNPMTSEITLELNAPANEKATFNIRYLIYTAGWAPKYDVRSTGLNEPVQLVYRANIFNNCGLDWNNTRIRLSTSDPLQGAEKPTIEKWDISEQIEMNDIKRMPAMQTMAGVAITKVTGDPGFQNVFGNNEKIEFQQIEIQELSAEFDIPLPYTILSDNKPYTVDVTEYKLPARYEHYAAPKLDKEAFLTARIVGWNALNLISGQASVYFNGTYLGQSFINTASVDDTLTISLGRDKKIAMMREMDSELNKRQVMGNNEKETFYFKTALRNNRDIPVTLLLEDQLPVSSKGDIAVDALELSGAELDKNTGKLTWHVQLQPGESRTVILGYSVKYPKGMSMKKKKFRTTSAPSF